MTLAPSAGDAAVLTFACAVLALVTRALTPGGVVAAGVVGACVSAGFGLPGLAVLGTFFVVGTLATRVGWKTKKARGTAEAGEGRRDWKRVVGKGGVAAGVAALAVAGAPVLGDCPDIVFAGAVAAALADTLATEIGTLSPGRVLLVPAFRLVPAGTPGAMSILGTLAAAGGAALVALAADATGLVRYAQDPAHAAMQQVMTGIGLAICGFLACVAESLAVGCGLRAPGFVRNLLTTAVGAALARGLWVAR